MYYNPSLQTIKESNYKIYKNIAKYFIKSLQYYNLSKSRIELCNTFMIGYIFDNKLSLKIKVNKVLNKIKFDENIYTLNQYQTIIQKQIDCIRENINNPYCINLKKRIKKSECLVL